MALKIALFPGTFDPLTLGHTDIIERAALLFDKVYVGIGLNQNKRALFPAEKRKEWIDTVFQHQDNVSALIYTSLTVDCCKEINAQFIVRGIRYIADFDYEKSIADTNYALNPHITTVMLTCRPAYHFITSSIVRDIFLHQGDLSTLVPPPILSSLNESRNTIHYPA